MGYSRLVKWIDWQAMKLGAPIVIVDPRDTSSECPNCDSKLEENGYRRLKCPRCGFEADRDVMGKLNIRKRALKILGISGRSLAPLTAPQMTDVNPNRWGEPMSRPQRGGGTLALKGGEEVRLANLTFLVIFMRLMSSLMPSQYIYYLLLLSLSPLAIIPGPQQPSKASEAGSTSK
jgi:hypothetical protein